MSAPLKKIGNEDRTKEFDLPTAIRDMSKLLQLAKEPDETGQPQEPQEPQKTQEVPPVSKSQPEISQILKALIKEVRKQSALQKDLPNLVRNILEQTHQQKNDEDIKQSIQDLQKNQLLELKNDVKEMFKGKISELQDLMNEKHRLETDIDERKVEKKALDKEIERLKEEVCDLKMLHETYQKSDPEKS